MGQNLTNYKLFRTHDQNTPGIITFVVHFICVMVQNAWNYTMFSNAKSKHLRNWNGLGAFYCCDRSEREELQASIIFGHTAIVVLLTGASTTLFFVFFTSPKWRAWFLCAVERRKSYVFMIETPLRWSRLMIFTEHSWCPEISQTFACQLAVLAVNLCFLLW